METERIQDVINAIRSIPINEIIGEYVDLKKSGMSYLGLCPFHADSHLGSFVVTPSKGIWKCFACGDGYAGDAIKFVSLYKGEPRLDAAMDIAQSRGIISQAEYQQYLYRKDRKEIKQVKRIVPQQRKRAVSVKTASATVKDKVYRSIKEFFGLSEEDKKYLREERHLPDDRIYADYFTFCPESDLKSKGPVVSFERKDKNALVAYVRQKTGCSTDELITVPGFFYDKKKQCVEISGRSDAVGILIHNADGLVSGIQFRKKTKEKGGRYCWLSSSFALDEPEKYKGGAPVGSQKDVLFPRGGKERRTLCITEGRFKSEILAEKGNAVISIQGVSTWPGISKTVSAVIKKEPEMKAVFMMFDSDILGNHELMRHLKAMYRKLKEDFSLPIYTAVWRKEYGKGIDDCILAGNEKRIRYFPFETVARAADTEWEEMTEKMKKNGVSFKKMPPEQRRLFTETLQTRTENRLLGPKQTAEAAA